MDTKLKRLYIFLSAFGFLVFAGIAHPETTFAAANDWPQKGVSIRSAWNGDFASQSFKQSIDNLAATGANYVSLVFNYYQSNDYSTDIQPGADTPTDSALISAIDYIHSKGIKVMLKPHLDAYSGGWRANINPGDRATWFANYGNMINHYAQIAQAHNVESYCIGTELVDMSASSQNYSNTQYWIDMINGIRKIYSGQLTYSANWGPPGFGDEKNHIDFWPYLDFVGVSAYFNLYSDNSVSGLENAWNSYLDDLQSLSQRTGKPIVLTEIGYKSVTNAHLQPWDYGYGGPPDQQEQANDYTALFDFWGRYSWVHGVHLWEWRSDPNAGGPNDTDYTPQHKTAQDVMASWFGANGNNPAGSQPPDPALTGLSCASPANNAFTGCYYSSQDFTKLAFTRTDNAINFDWGGGSPDPKVPVDHFSARWQGNFNFNAGNYYFTATADDGIKVYVDNNLVLNKFFDQPATTYNFIQDISGGTHLITVEYYENGGNAVAKLSWTQAGIPSEPSSSCPGPADNAFSGCYYLGQNFNNLVLSRTDNSVNFDWGGGSPDPKVPADQFSAKWQGNFNFNSAGDYAFTATADDGVKVFLDGNPIIDQWHDQPATSYTTIKNLASGTHNIKMEYYEAYGNAVAKLSWTQINSGSTPPSTLPPPNPNSPANNNIVYTNGYPTINGNYIDCSGNIDNDAAHHTLDPSDRDPAHHSGQQCPANSFVGVH
ncbi:MAG: PA14 domain-containing protein [Patescibacteria group bacterium]|nr:PA14 domain-containing protein [Patescibacteria group bacterium]